MAGQPRGGTRSRSGRARHVLVLMGPDDGHANEERMWINSRDLLVVGGAAHCSVISPLRVGVLSVRCVSVTAWPPARSSHERVCESEAREPRLLSRGAFLCGRPAVNCLRVEQSLRFRCL